MSQHSTNGTRGRPLTSREIQQAVLRQQQQQQQQAATQKPPISDKSGIRRGKGSVPAVRKQKQQVSGLDRDLRDEIDAW